MTELCDIAGVSRFGYYAWLRAGQHREEREAQDQADFRRILAAYRFRGYADYIQDGYEVEALHYLMKPVSEQKLYQVLDRAA